MTIMTIIGTIAIITTSLPIGAYNQEVFAGPKKTGLFCFSNDILTPTCYSTKSQCESGRQFAEATGGQMTECKHF
jgi:hypothetical protein